MASETADRQIVIFVCSSMTVVAGPMISVWLPIASASSYLEWPNAAEVQ
jgi:hypothetical protein